MVHQPVHEGKIKVLFCLPKNRRGGDSLPPGESRYEVEIPCLTPTHSVGSFFLLVLLLWAGEGRQDFEGSRPNTRHTLTFFFTPFPWTAALVAFYENLGLLPILGKGQLTQEAAPQKL